MSVESVHSLITWRTRCPKQDAHRHKSFWAILPNELKERILDLVENPTRLARVSHELQLLSSHSYTLLLKEYETLPALMGLIPFSQRQQLPPVQVQMIYQTIMGQANNAEVELQDFQTEGSPLHTTRLVQIQKFSCLRLADKAAFFRSLFDWLTLSFEGKTNEQIIKICEGHWQNDSQAIINLRLFMNLANQQLTHIPTHIGHLKKLTTLNLNNNQLTALPPEMASLTALTTLQIRGNPLTTESVKNICQSLPHLKNVTIDSEQPGLIELFETSFPQINVTVTQLIRIEEPI